MAGHNDHSTDGALDMEAMKWIFYLDAVGPDTGVRTPTPPHLLPLGPGGLAADYRLTLTPRVPQALRVIPGSHLLMGEERLAFASTVSSLPLTEVPATACTTEPGDVIGPRPSSPLPALADG